MFTSFDVHTFITMFWYFHSQHTKVIETIKLKFLKQVSFIFDLMAL